MAMAALPENTPEARVLVVDDETNIVELLSVSLKFQGFEVHTASSGPAASGGGRREPAQLCDGKSGIGLGRVVDDAELRHLPEALHRPELVSHRNKM